MPSTGWCGACAVVYGRGMGTGWVLGGAIPGTTQPPCTARGAQACTAKRAPEGPARAWSGWYMPGWARVPRTTLRARSVTPGPLPVLGTRFRRLLANKARFTLILLKVSQNGRVSRKYVEKACHSPYLQNSVQKSPLEILRFPF